MNKIPVLDLKREYEYMKGDIDSAIRGCLKHQRWISGPEVEELEAKISKYLGVRYCIGVSSGTDALVISLRALAIKLKDQEYFDRDDKVITTPFVFTATGDSILRVGAKPAFVDIDLNTFNLDPTKIRDCLKHSKTNKVVGIIPVHLYGQACNMDEVMDTADKYNLFVLEDVAQAFGGMWDGKKLGSIGTAGAFSFFPSKNLGGFGDGGMIATNDDDVAEIARILKKHGGKDKYSADHIGYNARLDTIQAAVLLAKFKYVEELNKRRRSIAKKYDKCLKDIGELILPKSLPKAYHVYHQYTIRTSKRDDLQSYLNKKGVSTRIYYSSPLHKMRLFSNCVGKITGSLENAEKASGSVLSLPIEPLQSEEETAYVIESVRGYFR